MTAIAALARPPRRLHPVAWWVWALCLAAAVSRTTNPLLLALVIVAALVVAGAREDPDAVGGLGGFLWIAVVVIVIRVGATALFGSPTGSTVLVDLPRWSLPAPLDRIALGGPLTAESLVQAGAFGLQLAAMLTVVGVVNALASARRLLRYTPATLYDVGTAVVVAISFAPLLVADAARARRAARLRGQQRVTLRLLGRLVVATLEGALERSLQLAASMDARGYGRSVHRSRRRFAAESGLAVVGLLGVLAGIYGLLDGSTPSWLGAPPLIVGVVLASASLIVGARRDPRSRYRRDPWSTPETLVVACGSLPLLVLLVMTSYDEPWLAVQVSPLAAPIAPWPVLLAVAVAALPALIAPPLRVVASR